MKKLWQKFKGSFDWTIFVVTILLALMLLYVYYLHFSSREVIVPMKFDRFTVLAWGPR